MGSSSHWPVDNNPCLFCARHYIPIPVSYCPPLQMGKWGQSGDMWVTCSGSPSRMWVPWLTPGSGVTLMPAFDTQTTPEGRVKADAGKGDVKSRVGMNEPFPTSFRTPLPPSVRSMTSLLLASSLMADDLCDLTC